LIYLEVLSSPDLRRRRRNCTGSLAPPERSSVKPPVRLGKLAFTSA